MTLNFEKLICLKNSSRKLLSPNRKSTISATTSPNCIAKTRMNLFLLDCEYSGYVNKLIRTDLVNKILGRESSRVLAVNIQDSQQAALKRFGQQNLRP